MASRRGEIERNEMGQYGRTTDPPLPSRNTSETSSLHSVRKRTSFFGRSNSDASSMRRAPATSHSSKPSFSTGRIDDDASRPTTATSSDIRRRKTDPLQSIRDSLFGVKKKPAREWGDASSSRPPSKGTDSLPHDVSVDPGSFRSEDECRELSVPLAT